MRNIVFLLSLALIGMFFPTPVTARSTGPPHATVAADHTVMIQLMVDEMDQTFRMVVCPNTPYGGLTLGIDQTDGLSNEDVALMIVGGGELSAGEVPVAMATTAGDRVTQVATAYWAKGWFDLSTQTEGGTTSTREDVV